MKYTLKQKYRLAAPICLIVGNALALTTDQIAIPFVLFIVGLVTFSASFLVD